MKNLKTLNEEINRMKSLFNYKKGTSNVDDLIIYEQEDRNNTGALKDNCTMFNYTGEFSVANVDASENFNDFIVKLKEKIDGEFTDKSTPIFIKKINVLGGASNHFKGKATAADVDNDYTTPYSGDIEKDSGYEANVKYAKGRAINFIKGLVSNLEKINLSDPSNILSDLTNIVKTKVIDTGGKNDSKRNQSLNPGQIIKVEMEICQKETFTRLDETPETPPTDLSTFITYFKSGFVLTGSYYCNGKNSRDDIANKNLWDNNCTEVQKNEDRKKDFKDNPHIAAFEIKYKLNVGGNDEVRPVTRWKFYWDKNNKIVKVEQEQVNKNWDPNGIFPSKEVSPDDELLRLCMRGGDTSKPEIGWEKFVKPFI